MSPSTRPSPRLTVHPTQPSGSGSAASVSPPVDRAEQRGPAVPAFEAQGGPIPGERPEAALFQGRGGFPQPPEPPIPGKQVRILLPQG